MPKRSTTLPRRPRWQWFAVCGLIAGCTFDPGDDSHGDRPDRRHGNETIERSIIASSAKYDLAQAKAYREIAEDIADGKVFNTEQVQAKLDKDLGGKDGGYMRAFHPKNQLLHDAAEGGRYGRREQRIFEAIARGFEMSAKAKGGLLTDDDRKGDE